MTSAMCTADDPALARLRPHDVGGDLRDRSPGELRRLFEWRGGVSFSRLYRAALVQAVRQNLEAARRGEPPPFEGHLRTLWHDLIEPLMHRLPEEHWPGKPYKHLVSTLSELVFDRGVLTYSDLNLTDRTFEDRRIGTTRPEVLVVAEKRGLFRLLRRVHEQTGVTVWATAGYPPGTGSELTARHVLDATKGRPEVHVLGLVDYGPSGSALLRAVEKHLTFFGLRLQSVRSLFHAGLVPPPLRARAARPVPEHPYWGPLIERWMAETGGVDGRLMRLDIETLRPDALEALLLDAVETLDAR